MNKKSKLYLVIAILIAIVATVGIKLNQPAYALTVDVNPSIEIKANRLNRVVKINPLNEDARRLLKDFNHKDKSLQKTVEDLADLMVLKGYISGGKDNLVMITVNDEYTDQKVVDKLNQAIAAYLHNKQIEATIVNQAISTNSSKSGKEVVADRIKALDDDSSMEELSNMTLKELVKYAEARNIAADKLFREIIKTTTNSKADNLEITTEKKAIITAEEAKRIALDLVDGEIVKFELDDYDDLFEKDDDDNPEYEVKIIANGFKYEIEIDAVTGKVLEFEKDDLDDRYDDDYDRDDKKISVNTNKSNNTTKNVNKYDKGSKKEMNQIISADEAKRIALGLANGKIVEFELDDDDDNLEYKIEIIANGIEYEIEIDALTGKVLEFEADDYDDDWDDNDDDDDDD